MNTVEMFHSLSALPGYNNLLMLAVGLPIPSLSSLQVLHVPGAENLVADALSRGLFKVTLSLHPGLVLRLFQPPLSAVLRPTHWSSCVFRQPLTMKLGLTLCDQEGPLLSHLPA